MTTPDSFCKVEEVSGSGQPVSSPLPPFLHRVIVTPREREVLVQVARGRSNSEIAEDLHMSAATAKTHVSRLLMKLEARDRAQLVVIAYEGGLMQVG
jgi:DNA-binding NarL/FixJ family response regulator